MANVLNIYETKKVFVGSNEVYLRFFTYDDKTFFIALPNKLENLQYTVEVTRANQTKTFAKTYHKDIQYSDILAFPHETEWILKNNDEIKYKITYVYSGASTFDSGSITVKFPNSPPSISGKNEDLGFKNTPFSLTYRVDDVDAEDAVLKVVEKLNNEVIRTFNASKNQDLVLSITEDLLYKLPLDKDNNITIEVTDSTGGLASRNYKFKRTNSAPKILEESKDFGNLSVPLIKDYTVLDVDNDLISIVEKLDDVVLKNLQNLKTPQTLTINLFDKWDKLSIGKHTIAIEVTDTNNSKELKVFTFNKTTAPLANKTTIISVLKNKNYVVKFNKVGTNSIVTNIKTLNDSILKQETSSTEFIFNSLNNEKVKLNIVSETHELNVSNIMVYEGDALNKEYEESIFDDIEIIMQQPLMKWDKLNSKGIVERNSGFLILNGSEDKWFLQSDQSNSTTLVFYIVGLPVLVPNTIEEEKNPTIMSDKFDYKYIWDKSIEEEGFFNGIYNKVVFRVLKSKLNIVDTDTDEVKMKKFKSFLVSNPVSLTYKLPKLIAEDTKTNVNLKAYDFLRINSGAIQPTLTYKYAKNIVERISIVEDILSSTLETYRYVEQDNKTYLYKNGDVCSEIAQGWTGVSSYRISNLDSCRKLTKDNIQLRVEDNGSSDWSGVSIATNKKIDLSKYTKIYADIESHGTIQVNDTVFGVDTDNVDVKKNSVGVEMKFAPSIEKRTTISLDVSNIKAGYVFFKVYAGGAEVVSRGINSLIIYNVWME